MIDITRDLLTTPPYPGDQGPSLHWVCRMPEDAYNASRLECSVHAGTHMDAPLHFLPGGADIASLSLDALMGDCLVLDADQLTACHAGDVPPRLLLRGTPALSGPRLAHLLSLSPVLVGTDTASVGSCEDEHTAHLALFAQDVVIVENLDLSAVPDGLYKLVVLPVKLCGAEAAPCRAMLLPR